MKCFIVDSPHKHIATRLHRKTFCIIQNTHKNNKNLSDRCAIDLIANKLNNALSITTRPRSNSNDGLTT